MENVSYLLNLIEEEYLVECLIEVPAKKISPSISRSGLYDSVRRHTGTHWQKGQWMEYFIIPARFCNS